MDTRFGALLPLLLFLLLSPLSAQKAYFYCESYPGEYEYEISDSSLLAASSAYPEGSVLEVIDKESGKSSVVSVMGPLRGSLTERDLALSKEAIKEMDNYGKGMREVTIRPVLIPASTAEGETDSGWYSFITPPYQATSDAYLAYSRLERNGFKPRAMLTAEGIIITINYIRAFEEDEAKLKIALSGLDSVSLEKAESPYL